MDGLALGCFVAMAEEYHIVLAVVAYEVLQVRSEIVQNDCIVLHDEDRYVFFHAHLQYFDMRQAYSNLLRRQCRLHRNPELVALGIDLAQ